MANQTPDANITYQAYYEGYLLIGTTQIDLPTLQSMTVDVQGAGIAGVIQKAIAGMFQSTTTTLNFRTVTRDAARLYKAGQHHLEFWGAVQATDSGTGRFITQQHKLILRGEFKNLTPGKFAVAETQDRTLEMEVAYLKELLDGEELLEMDKYNHIFRVMGEDQMAAVRAAIGL